MFLKFGRIPGLVYHHRSDAAREGAERIEELERRVAQLEQELEPARKQVRELEIRARELEIATDERAHLLNEKDEELALVRETLTKCLSESRLEQALDEIGQK
jgi:hypothetical protein